MPTHEILVTTHIDRTRDFVVHFFRALPRVVYSQDSATLRSATLRSNSVLVNSRRFEQAALRGLLVYTGGLE